MRKIKMNSKTKILIGILVVGIVLFGGYWIWGIYQVSKEKGESISRLLPEGPLKKDIIIEKITGGGWAPLPEKQITPDFRLYDDGMVVYKKYLKPDQTEFKFMIGKLSNSDISELLSFIENQQFFELQDHYVYGNDIPAVSITIRRRGRLKTVVVEGIKGRDGLANFWRICKRLDTVDIDDGIQYNPQRITLFVYLFKQANPKEFNLWPAQRVDLEQASRSGKLIIEKQETIQQVMEAMKDRTMGNQITNFFRFRDRAYQIVVKIHFPDE